MSSLDSQELTAEEIAKLTKALKQKEFGDLFKDYLDEISDPTHRKEYEQYLTDLEAKGEMPRGKKLLWAKPGVCLSSHLLFKSGQKQKIYLNICQTTEIGKFSISSDSNVSLPHILSPPRVDRDENSDHNCLTADLAVHPATLDAGMRDRRILKIILDVVAESMTTSFFRGHETVSRDFRLEKITCKGGRPMPFSVDSAEPPAEPPAAVVASVSPADIRKLQEEAAALNAALKAALKAAPAEVAAELECPEITYRLVESESMEIGSNAKSVKVIFTCSEVSSAKELDLDVSAFTVSLKTKSAQVTVDLARKFPDGIDAQKVKAKFDKTKKELTLDLPVSVKPQVESQPDPMFLPMADALPDPVPSPSVVLQAEAADLPPADPAVALVDQPQAAEASSAPAVEAALEPLEAPKIRAAPPLPTAVSQLPGICVSFAGQNRQNVFFQAAVAGVQSAEVRADRTGAVVAVETREGRREWAVVLPVGHFIDKRQVHVTVEGETVWLVCRKSTAGEWKQLHDPTREFDWRVFEEPKVEAVKAVEAAEAEQEEEFTGLETYCHAIRLNYPWLYALF